MAISDALFTSTQQRVLGALFGQPDRSFFVTQIMELAKSGRGAVQRELERLHRGGLVTVHKVATQKHFQADATSPLFNELCGIIQKTVGLAGPIRAPHGHELCACGLRRGGHRDRWPRMCPQDVPRFLQVVESTVPMSVRTLISQLPAGVGCTGFKLAGKIVR